MKKSTSAPVIVALCTVLIGLSGCTSTSSESGTPSAGASMGSAAYPQEVETCGQKVVLEKKPERILAGGREGVANLVAAGGADQMIGRYAEHGAEQSPLVEQAVKDVKQLETSTGSAHAELSFETVLEAQPDLIYGSAIGVGDYELANLEKYNITGIMPPSSCVYITNVEGVNRADLSEITQHIRDLGTWIGSEAEANKNADALDQELADATKEGQNLKEMTVAGLYYWDATDDLFSYGENSTLQGIFDVANLKNVVDPKYDAMLNGAIQAEAIIAANPEVIVITTGEGGITLEDSLARLKKIPGMEHVDAVKNNRIIELPSGAAYVIPDAIDAVRTVIDARKNL